jgi:hypothetical protein
MITFSSTFAVKYKFWTVFALCRLFLGRFQLNFQVIIFTDVPSFLEKYPKIK